MQIPDLINGIFEGGGALIIWLSIFKILKDKLVRGVHWGPIAFFSVWGFWNIYYYWHLNQILSWICGIGVTVTNTIYLGLLLYYLRRERNKNDSMDYRTN